MQLRDVAPIEIPAFIPTSRDSAPDRSRAPGGSLRPRSEREAATVPAGSNPGRARFAPRLALIALAAAFAGCNPPDARNAEAPLADGEPSADATAAAVPAPPADTQLAADVRVTRIAPGLWVHTTLHEFPSGASYPANGALLETDSGSVLFDAGWNDHHAEVLLAWADSVLHKPVRRAVITHAHNDRFGGVAALRRAGVQVSALAATSRITAQEGLPAPDSIPGLAAAAQPDAAGFELFYPGPGHSPDNIVVYFPRQQTIFGGCLIKPDSATTTGNVADADVPNWPRAVARVRERYPDTRIVVPGHGAIGGPNALHATERLIETKGPAAVEALRSGGGQ